VVRKNYLHLSNVDGPLIPAPTGTGILNKMIINSSLQDSKSLEVEGARAEPNYCCESRNGMFRNINARA
jgi:hypothetical protein